MSARVQEPLCEATTISIEAQRCTSEATRITSQKKTAMSKTTCRLSTHSLAESEAWARWYKGPQLLQQPFIPGRANPVVHVLGLAPMDCIVQHLAGFLLHSRYNRYNQRCTLRSVLCGIERRTQSHIATVTQNMFKRVVLKQVDCCA